MAKSEFGKKSDDPLTVFWSFAKYYEIDKKTAQGFLDAANGDPEKAVDEMQERLSFSEETIFD